ncbi:MAG TPA: DUF4259 domain-containing protein [Gemmatimonadaceae bacterium]|nr:DUF4259 domain-containing protein [Gemmatimonadaceae bacterium]
MGIWGVEGFANDEALDWIETLDPSDGIAPVERELHAVANAPDPHLTAARAEIALAAAELLAAVGGHPHPALPPAARRWLEAQHPAEADVGLGIDALVEATRALDFVVTSSQLAERWTQRVDERAWRAALDDLRMRLARAGGVPRA